MKPRRLCAAALVLLATNAPAVRAATLGQRVDAIVRASGFTGPSTGIAILDATRNQFVYRRNALVQLKPASNTKLTTTAAALAKLGIGTRLHTDVYSTGMVSGTTLHGSLWLVGGGDPSLSSSPFTYKAFGGASGRIGDLAAAVKAAGILRVTGHVYGDESAFDRVRVGPLWKAIYHNDCPPLTALSVNEDLVRFGHPNAYANPPLRSAQVLIGALRAQGVRVDGTPGVATRPTTAGLVASEASPRIYRLVQEMNLPSDNFFAEVLNKDIAVHEGLPGTTHNGRVVTRAYLESLGIDLTGARFYDGSGLSLGDRLSARQILAVLRRASLQKYGWFFRNSLPLAGVSGTLSHRMRSGPAYRNARAKTGTLDDASALSGYVTSANGHEFVFSIVMNHEPLLNITAAHALQDRIVQTLAGSRPA